MDEELKQLICWLGRENALKLLEIKGMYCAQARKMAAEYIWPDEFTWTKGTWD